MGQWTPEDLALISDMAYHQLAMMLNAIEEGAPWPEQLLHATAIWLAKDPDVVCDALNHRILLIGSAIYRKYATTRLRHCKPWVKQWTTEDMFAGVEAMCAEEAWYSTAIQVEHARITGEPVSGASVDILKCVD